MLKAPLLAACLVAIAYSPTFAADDMCTDAHMKQMDDMVAKMADATNDRYVYRPRAPTWSIHRQ